MEDACNDINDERSVLVCAWQLYWKKGGQIKSFSWRGELVASFKVIGPPPQSWFSRGQKMKVPSVASYILSYSTWLIVRCFTGGLCVGFIGANTVPSTEVRPLYYAVPPWYVMIWLSLICYIIYTVVHNSNPIQIHEGTGNLFSHGTPLWPWPVIHHHMLIDL